MGWWKTRSGTVIGDPPANYLDSLEAMGLTYPSVRELPGEIRERINAIYVEGLGRKPKDDDIRDLIAFCWGDRDQHRWGARGT